MAGSMNKVIIIGRVGQDPKINHTQSGQTVANLSVATDEGYKDKNTGQRVERTEWHKVVVWRQAAEFVANYVGKGRLICVEGKLQTRKYQDQNGQDRYSTEIVADRIQALDRGNDNPQGGQVEQQEQPQPNTGPGFPSEASGMEDVPF